MNEEEVYEVNNVLGQQGTIYKTMAPNDYNGAELSIRNRRYVVQEGVLFSEGSSICGVWK